MHPESWKVRLIKSAGITLVLFSLTDGVIDRVRIGVDLQDTQCLSRGRVFLIDLAERDFRRGDLIVFEQPPLIGETMPRPSLMIKQVAGLPGDQVARIGDQVMIDGHAVVSGFPHRLEGRIQLPRLRYPFTLPPGSYFGIGTHPRALDSRYLGPIPPEHIKGKAYALLD